MRTDELPLALLGFLAIVAVVPAWVHYSGSFDPASGGHGLLASLMLPAVVLLFAVSWISPGMTRQVLGGYLVVAVLVLAPIWWHMSGLAAEAAASNPLAQVFIRLSLPVLVLAGAVSIGYAKLRASGGGRPS